MEVTRHDPEHEGLLLELLADSADADEPRVRAQLETCAVCRDKAQELLRLRALLDRAGREERATLAAALAEESPGAGRVRAILEELADREPHAAAAGRNGRPRRLGWWGGGILLVAASLALLVWLNRGDGEQDGRPAPFMLGSGSIELIQPVGEVAGARYPAFRWDASLPPGAWFVVVVEDLAGKEIASSKPLEQTIWTPEVPLPDAIRWYVLVVQPDGSEEPSRTARASLSR